MCLTLQYTYHPQVLYCYGKALCTIPRDSPYYAYENKYYSEQNPYIMRKDK